MYGPRQISYEGLLRLEEDERAAEEVKRKLTGATETECKGREILYRGRLS